MRDMQKDLYFNVVYDMTKQANELDNERIIWVTIVK
jgi:hypothetical protein